jgi:hypothetical protein
MCGDLQILLTPNLDIYRDANTIVMQYGEDALIPTARA